jgi:hypothetical protein
VHDQVHDESKDNSMEMFLLGAGAAVTVAAPPAYLTIPALALPGTNGLQP